jgi:hypothetical protein
VGLQRSDEGRPEHRLPNPLMGQNRRSRGRNPVSASPPTADMPSTSGHFGNGPIPDSPSLNLCVPVWISKVLSNVRLGILSPFPTLAFAVDKRDAIALPPSWERCNAPVVLILRDRDELIPDEEGVELYTLKRTRRNGPPLPTWQRMICETPRGPSPSGHLFVTTRSRDAGKVLVRH